MKANASTRFLSLASAACLSLLPAPLVVAAEEAKPNIIVIFTDDQGYGDVGCYGAQGFQTPNLDRMAQEGMRFTDFYVGCPVCSGSRTALMTGCHFQRLSMAPVLFPRSNEGLHPDEMLIPEVLKPQGYATGCVGKWHLGHLPPCLPTMQGFDYYFGIPYSNDMWIDPANKIAADAKLHGVTREQIQAKDFKPPRNDSPVLRNDEIVEFPVDQDTLTRRYTEEAVKFIHDHKGGPFFLYLPHTLPHLPLHVGKEFAGRTKTKFGDIMEEIDWSVGEVLKAVKDAGIDDNTLVIFTTDNGTRSGSSGPLRGQKASVYEGGVRVPCLARWPGKVPAGSECREVAATIDFLPTFAKLTGAALPERKIDGKDIWPLLAGEDGAKSPHEHYILLHGKGSVRSGKWKFYPWPEGAERSNKKNAGAGAKAADRPPVQLYDLSADLGEKKNVAAEHPDVVKELDAAFKAFAAEIKRDKRPTAKLKRG